MRTKRLEEELAVMEPLTVSRLPAYSEERIHVTSWSTIRVKFNTYSVPSRLIGEKVKVRIYDDRLEVYFADVRQLVTERLQGRKHHHIDYRHIIWWLVRKPGAFARYRYREDLFPSLEFRRAFDALCEHRSPRNADIAYLRILHLAASTMEAHVQLVQRLLVARRDLTLERELRRLDRFDVVILDDLGYVQQDRAEMEVLFTFLAERYERKSVIITSNLVFSQWDRIFKDPMTTAAAIDRIVHHSVILELTGDSYRNTAAQAERATQADPS